MTDAEHNMKDIGLRILKVLQIASDAIAEQALTEDELRWAEETLEKQVRVVAGLNSIFIPVDKNTSDWAKMGLRAVQSIQEIAQVWAYETERRNE